MTEADAFWLDEVSGEVISVELTSRSPVRSELWGWPATELRWLEAGRSLALSDGGEAVMRLEGDSPREWQVDDAFVLPSELRFFSTVEGASGCAVFLGERVGLLDIRGRLRLLAAHGGANVVAMSDCRVVVSAARGSGELVLTHQNSDLVVRLAAPPDGVALPRLALAQTGAGIALFYAGDDVGVFRRILSGDLKTIGAWERINSELVRVDQFVVR